MHGAAAQLGVRGPKSIAVVFGTLWPADVASMHLLGLGEPLWHWSNQEFVIDVADKLVLAIATGMVYEALSARS